MIIEKLAIKGHNTRGKEVIELLEMFGGKNIKYYIGINPDSFYFIDDGNTTINLYNTIPTNYTIFTLEEFLEKYPYKVGDKVQYKDATSCGSVFEVEKLLWEDNQVKYIINRLLFNNDKTKVTSKNLQLYKEEKTMGEKETFTESEGTLVAIDLTKEFRKADNIEVILGDYDFVCKDGKTYFVKNYKYPKTYDECCKVFGLNHYLSINWINYDLSITTCVPKQIDDIVKKLKSLSKLIICRDAYWKIAGEEIGLNGPWEPDWSTECEKKYVIEVYRNNVRTNSQGYSNTILAFPTAEMRNAFYENFKDLIEKCKELL